MPTEEVWENGVLISRTDERTLDEARAEKLAVLAEYRFGLETSGIIWNTWPVDTAREVRGNLMGIYLGARDGYRPEGAGFKFSDGISRPLTNVQAQQMAVAVLGYVQACFDHEKALAELVSAATTNDAVDAVDIRTGWPSPLR